MSDHEKQYGEIFKRLSKEDFMEDPARILPLMMDFGFDARQVRMLRTVMAEDMKEVKEFLQSSPGSGYEILKNIADYCLVSDDALKNVLEGIRSSLDDGVPTEIIDDIRYGRCRRSLDKIAMFSLDMTVLLNVGDVKSFLIPDSVTMIGKGAFSGCISLENVVIPDSVTVIGAHAFSDCRSLTEVVIPDSVTMIGAHAFEWCKSLTEVVIPDSVTTIGAYAFSGCESLTEVVIPDSVTEIGYGAFQGCRSILFSVSGRNKYYISESGALFDKKMKVLIAGYALVHDGKCVIPDSVTEIGAYAFHGCESLTEVVIPDSVTTIGKHAFDWCLYLTEVVIPDSVTEIGDGAFPLISQRMFN